MDLWKTCELCWKYFLKKVNENKKYWETKRFCSHECYTKNWFTQEHKNNISLWRKEWTTETFICKECWKVFERFLCMTKTAKYCSRECKDKPHKSSWKTKLNQLIRTSARYLNWRNEIHKRDNYTCQICGNRWWKLHVDHIKQFALILKENNINSVDDAMLCDELWDMNNLRTLCEECHRKTETYWKCYI
jgi:5-methylcytosine-specific restriction endonuclease McrA